jgi:small ligand-binding sensory domain FIST
MRRLLLVLATFAYARAFHASPMPRYRTCLTNHAHESWHSQVSSDPNAADAVEELFEGLVVDDDRPKLAFLFVSQAHGRKFESIVQSVYAKLKGNSRLISILAGGVVGGNVELDEPTKPSMSLLTGVLPEQTDFELFYFNELTKAPPDPQSPYWKTLVGNQEHRSSIVFVDPWSPFEIILEGLSNNKAVVAGGISVPSGVGPTVGIDGKVLPQGSIVGVCFRSGIGLQAIVAQGCTTVGPSYTVTACESHCILELDGKPALAVLEEMANSASEEEQKKISSSLVCGIASPDQEDYLVRQIIGFVPNKNGIAIGDSVKVGDKFQFHVRDRTAAQSDLRLMMKRAKTERLFDENIGKPVAALQISCVARGRGLFGTSNVDLESIQGLLDGRGPVGGCFANGEIGPVGIAGFSSTNDEGAYLHGFTTVAALICDYSDVAKDAVDDKGTTVDEPADAWG